MILTCLFLVCFGQTIGLSFHMYGSSTYAIVGESFKFTCITTSKYLIFRNTHTNLIVITGGDSNGNCKISGSYITNYTYSCYPSNYTYEMTIPGHFITEKLNATQWSCQEPFGGGSSNRITLQMMYRDVDVAISPVTPVLVQVGTPIKFKCKTPIRESWKNTVFSDEVLGTIATFISSNDSCNTTGNILDVYYKPFCDLENGEFMVELKTAFDWHNGREVRCTVQYGSGNKLVDKYATSSTVIKLSDKPLLSMKPSVVFFGSNSSVTLTCKINNDKGIVHWLRYGTLITTITGVDTNATCMHSKTHENVFSYFCDTDNRKYSLIIPPESVTYGLNDVKWECSSGETLRSNAVRFSITDLPTISIPKTVSCNSSDTIWITCVMSTNLMNPKGTTTVWHHTINGMFIRTLKVKKENDTSFQLQIPFCSYQDMGSYSCHVTTGLNGLPVLNTSTEMTILGPPVIGRKVVTKSGSTLTISVEFYSDPFPEDPVWYFGNKTISIGSEYTKSTSVSSIKLTFYAKEVLVDGFISTLRIHNFVENNKEGFKFVVRNSFSLAEEYIFKNISDQTLQRGILENKSCSSALIGGVASGCIIGSSIITVILSLFIRKFYKTRNVLIIMIS